jgi:hypothetical protein
MIGSVTDGNWYHWWRPNAAMGQMIVHSSVDHRTYLARMQQTSQSSTGYRFDSTDIIQTPGEPTGRNPGSVWLSAMYGSSTKTISNSGATAIETIEGLRLAFYTGVARGSLTSTYARKAILDIDFMDGEQEAAVLLFPVVQTTGGAGYETSGTPQMYNLADGLALKAKIFVTRIPEGEGPTFPGNFGFGRVDSRTIGSTTYPALWYAVIGDLVVVHWADYQDNFVTELVATVTGLAWTSADQIEKITSGRKRTTGVGDDCLFAIAEIGGSPTGTGASFLTLDPAAGTRDSNSWMVIGNLVVVNYGGINYIASVSNIATTARIATATTQDSTLLAIHAIGVPFKPAATLDAASTTNGDFWVKLGITTVIKVGSVYLVGTTATMDDIGPPSTPGDWARVGLVMAGGVFPSDGESGDFADSAWWRVVGNTAIVHVNGNDYAIGTDFSAPRVVSAPADAILLALVKIGTSTLESGAALTSGYGSWRWLPNTDVLVVKTDTAIFTADISSQKVISNAVIVNNGGLAAAYVQEILGKNVAFSEVGGGLPHNDLVSYFAKIGNELLVSYDGDKLVGTYRTSLSAFDASFRPLNPNGEDAPLDLFALMGTPLSTGEYESGSMFWHHYTVSDVLHVHGTSDYVLQFVSGVLQRGPALTGAALDLALVRTFYRELSKNPDAVTATDNANGVWLSATGDLIFKYGTYRIATVVGNAIVTGAQSPTEADVVQVAFDIAAVEAAYAWRRQVFQSMVIFFDDVMYFADLDGSGGARQTTVEHQLLADVANTMRTTGKQVVAIADGIQRSGTAHWYKLFADGFVIAGASQNFQTVTVATFTGDELTAALANVQAKAKTALGAWWVNTVQGIELTFGTDVKEPTWAYSSELGVIFATIDGIASVVSDVDTDGSISITTSECPASQDRTTQFDIFRIGGAFPGTGYATDEPRWWRIVDTKVVIRLDSEYVIADAGATLGAVTGRQIAALNMDPAYVHVVLAGIGGSYPSDHFSVKDADNAWMGFGSGLVGVNDNGVIRVGTMPGGSWLGQPALDQAAQQVIIGVISSSPELFAPGASMSNANGEGWRWLDANTVVVKRPTKVFVATIDPDTLELSGAEEATAAILAQAYATELGLTGFTTFTSDGDDFFIPVFDCSVLKVNGDTLVSDDGGASFAYAADRQDLEVVLAIGSCEVAFVKGGSGAKGDATWHWFETAKKIVVTKGASTWVLDEPVGSAPLVVPPPLSGLPSDIDWEIIKIAAAEAGLDVNDIIPSTSNDLGDWWTLGNDLVLQVGVSFYGLDTILDGALTKAVSGIQLTDDCDKITKLAPLIDASFSLTQPSTSDDSALGYWIVTPSNVYLSWTNGGIKLASDLVGGVQGQCAVVINLPEHRPTASPLETGFETVTESPNETPIESATESPTESEFESGSDKPNGLGAGAIAGIVIASVVVVGVIVAAVVYFTVCRKPAEAPVGDSVPVGDA